MLNLKELEQSLDKALADETYESVIAWFQERDREKIQEFIGVKGYLHNLSAIHDKNTISETGRYFQKELEIPATPDLPFAA